MKKNYKNNKEKKRSRSGKAPQKIEKGIVKRHPDGFGFFVADNPEQADAYIAKNNMLDVMSGDHVEVELFPDRARPDRWRGKIKKILKRNTRQVVGLFHRLNDAEGVVLDDSHAWGEDIKISINDSLGAQENQLVAVELATYPGERVGLRGKVVSVIGSSNNAQTDTARVLHASGIPVAFSKRVEKECEKFGTHVNPDEFFSSGKKSKRKDLRTTPFITIDGVTAKDFDDAIYVSQNPKGFLLKVAIADVSHYVKKDSALDDEAYERGTSVYFPGHVTPMLPEALSNELCSLKPDVDRLALVCEMQISFDGELEKYNFYEAVIKSHARVTYGQAQDILDGEPVEDNNDENLFSSEVIALIKKASDLSKILLARRQKLGTLDFNIPESEVLINDQGMPIDIVRSERIFSNRLIEELMLVANISSARYLEDKNVEALCRIHEAPDHEAIQALERYMYNFGSKKKISGDGLQKKLTQALQEFEGKPEAQVLNILALRSMSQAKYSNNNIGHFGLGFTHYAHFTSPIRRYPDLIIHRLIKAAGKMNETKQTLPSAEDLESAGTFLSACEQRAVKAERRFVSIKKARFMNQFVGESFEGVISSVTKFGLFVLLKKYDVDGRLSMDDLGNDYWVFDDEHLCLRGKKSGKVYNIGDLVTVTIAKADADEGKIDFTLNTAKNSEGDQPSGEKTFASDKNRKANRPNDKKRGKAKKNRSSVRKARVSKPS